MSAKMLEKAGWVRVSRKKMGMVIIAKWHDPVSGEVYRQGYAESIQSERNMVKRRAQSQKEEGKV